MLGLGLVLTVNMVALKLVFVFTLVSFVDALSRPSSATHCATGGYKRDKGSGICQCIGNVYYCANNSPCNGPLSTNGQIGCNNNVFGDPAYRSRKHCYCLPSGCDAGQHGPGGNCQACAVGQYQNQNKFTGASCKNCEGGSYQDETGKSSCKACGAGTVASGVGNTGCSSCGPGTHQASPGQQICDACLEGQYQDGHGALLCKNCDKGHYQSSKQQTECHACGVGTANPHTTQAACENCGVGFYQDKTGQQYCIACDTGQYQAETTKNSCVECSRGQYQDVGGQSECIDCPVGRHGSITGLETSLCAGPCRKGYHCPLGSLSEMQRDCPPATEATLPDFERAQWYCREGEDRKMVSSGYYTIPQKDSALDHRENQLLCPAHYHCNNGIAKPKLLWAESTGCASSVVGHVQSVELDIPEDTTPAANLSSAWTFLAVTNGLQGATIRYGISLCANGCNGGVSSAGWLSLDDANGGVPVTFNPADVFGGVTLSNGNLKTNYPGYYSGAFTTAPALKSGRYYLELEVGGVHGSYSAYGFVSRKDIPNGYTAAQVLTTACYNSTQMSNPSNFLGREAFSVYLNDGDICAFDSMLKRIQLNGGTTYTTSIQQAAFAVDFDEKKFWVGTSPNKQTSPTWYPDQQGYSLEAWDGREMEFLVAPSATSGTPYYHARFSKSDWVWDPNEEPIFNYAKTCEKKSPTSGQEFSPFDMGFADGQLGITQALDAESCTEPYMLQILAHAVDTQTNEIVASTFCQIRVMVSNVNEPPQVLPQVRRVEEDSLVNTPIGDPLDAFDPEAAIGKQEILWSITSCKNNGVSVPTCPIKVSTCGGQLSVEDSSGLDYDSLAVPTYVLVVKVIDNDESSALFDDATVTVHVEPKNDPPAIYPSENIIFAPENTSIGHHLPRGIVAHDPENEPLTYAFTGSPGLFPFTVDATTGLVTLRGSLDYEHGNLRYLLPVKVVDSKGLEFGPVDVEIRVVDSNDAPKLAKSSIFGSISFEENKAQRRSIQFFDEDDGGVNSVLWGCCTSIVAVNDAPLVGGYDRCAAPNYPSYTFVSGDHVGYWDSTVALDYELNNNSRPCAFGVKVTDRGGLFYHKNIIINVLDSNDPPTIPVGQTCTADENIPLQSHVSGCEIYAVDQDQPTQVLTWRKGGGDSKLDIVGIGENKCTIKVIGALNFETSATLSVVTIVTDPYGGSAEGVVTLHIQDVNDAPIITNAHDYRIMLENMVNVPVVQAWNTRGTGNAGPSQSNGGPPNPRKIVGADEDTQPKWNTLTYSVPSQSGVAINSSSGVLTLTTAQDYEALFAASGERVAYITVPVTCCDNGGSIAGHVNLCATENVRIYIIDVDEAPVMATIDPQVRREVARDALANVQVGPPFEWRDDDFSNGPSSCHIVSMKKRIKGSGNSWSVLTGTDAVFAMDARNCQLLVKTDNGLNSLVGYEFNIAVKAKDMSRPYCSRDGGDNGFPGYGITDCQEYRAVNCDELASQDGASGTGGECIIIDGLDSNIIETFVDIVESTVPPVMQPGMLYYVAENTVAGGPIYSDAGLSNTRAWIPCFDDGVKRENTPACAPGDAMTTNSAICSALPLCSAHYCQSLYYTLDSGKTNPVGKLAIARAFDVSTAGAILPAPGLDYETLNGINEEIRCDNSLSRNDGQVGPYKGVCRVHDQEQFKKERALIGGVAPTRNEKRSYFGFYDFGGAQKLCSDNSWRLASGSELVVAFDSNNGINYVDYGPGDATATQVWSSEGDAWTITGGSITKVSPSPGQNTKLAVFCFTGGDLKKGTVGYSISVTCSDTGTGPIMDNGDIIGYTGRLTSTQTIFVEVVDINEPPSMTNATMRIKESAAVGYVLDKLVAVDEDIYSTIQFSWTPSNVPFHLDSTSGNVSVASTLNYELQNIYSLQVVATDNAGLTADAALHIHVLDVNEPPVVLPWAQAKVQENAGRGTVVGDPIVATDEDRNDYLVFSIVAGNVHSAFSFAGQASSLHANLIVHNTSAIDFERKQSYVLEIIVADAEGLTGTGVLQVSVLDVDDVTIDSVSVLTESAQMATGGGDKLVITGTNFGFFTPAKPAPTLTVSYSNNISPTTVFTISSSCSVTERNTVIKCESIPGFGSNMAITVHIAGESSGSATSTTKISYANPTITSIQQKDGYSAPHILATNGSEIVEIHGTNLGSPVGLTLEAQYGPGGEGYCAVLCRVVAANIQLDCETAPGTGTFHRWRVGNFEHQWESPLSQENITTSYTAPYISDVAPAILSTYGLEMLTLTGLNFGPNATVLTGCPSRKGSGTVNVALPRIIYANNIGLKYEAADCIILQSQTKITCRSVVGVGRQFQWQAIVSGQASPFSKATTDYKPPIISSIIGPGAFGSNTKGGDTFYLRGDFFGPAGSVHIDLVQYWNVEVKNIFLANSCRVEEAQRSMRCLSGKGVGKNFKYKVAIAGQDSNVGAYNGFYARPTLHGVKRTNDDPMDNSDTRGFTISLGETLPRYEVAVMNGENFGPANVSWNPIAGEYGTASVTYEAISCYVSIAHTQVRCTMAPGAGRKHSWTLFVGAQRSRSPTSSYGIPEILGISGAGAFDAHTDGGQVVQLMGRNYGPYPDGIHVTYGEGGREYAAKNCRAISNLVINCTTVPGSGQNLKWRVTVREQTNIDSPTMSYALPAINSITPSSSSTLGTVKSSENIFLNTSNSGLQDVLTTREILFGNHYKILPLSNPLLTASNGGFDVLAFQAPELLSGMKGFDIPISVAVKSGSSLVSIVESNKVLWSYDAPEITQISVKDHPTNINLLIVTVYGRNFGSAKLGPTPVDIYRVSLNRVQNNHETAIQMAFGNVAFLEGVQSWEQTAVRDKIVLVTATRAGNLTVSRGGVSSNQMSYTLLTPVIQSIKLISVIENLRVQVNSFPTLGNTPAKGALLEIMCKHCGTFVQGIRPSKTFVFIGNTQEEEKPCEIVAATVKPNVGGYASFDCIVPSGQGAAVGVYIKYDQYRSDPVNLQYSPPVLFSVDKIEVPTKGGLVAVTGKNFGDRTTATVFYGGEKAQLTTQTLNRSHYEVTAIVPPGIGASNRPIQVNVVDQISPIIPGLAVRYAPPVIVEIVRPLWRPSRGNWNVEILGYNFDTFTRATVKTAFTIGETVGEVIHTSYDKIIAAMPKFKYGGSNPIVVVGDQSSTIVSEDARNAARAAAERGSASDYQLSILKAMDYKNITMLARIARVVRDAGGLATAVEAAAYNRASEARLSGTANSQQLAITAGRSRTNKQYIIATAVMIVNHAFQSECYGEEYSTEENKDIVAKAREYDATLGKPYFTCQMSRPLNRRRRRLVSAFETGAVSLPLLVNVVVNATTLPTKGGVLVTVMGSHFGETLDDIRISIDDTSGVYPSVPVPRKDILSFTKDNDNSALHVLTTVRFLSPPGQGVNLRIRVHLKISDLGNVPMTNRADIVSYEPPTLLSKISSSPTDGCTPGRYEPALQWAARVEGVSPEAQYDQPEVYRRACVRPYALRLEGTNFGINPAAITVFITGATPLGGAGATAETFWVFDGTGAHGAYRRDSSCRQNGTFCFEHTHELLIVKGPIGHGKDLTLTLNVAGQNVSRPFSFQPPQVTRGQPNPYDGNGGKITIHGLNFGTKISFVQVIVNDKVCLNAQWNHQHPADGFPYVTCTAQKGVVGTTNISIFVADQWSTRMPVLQSIQRAAMRSVCLPGKYSIETGTRNTFWGRANPGELCSLCPHGALCQESTYEEPVATATFWLYRMDVSAGRLETQISSDSDALTLKEMDDYNRAAGLPVSAGRKRACPSERLFDPVLDRELIAEFTFADMHKQDECLEIVGCKPKEACKGGNTCNEGYEYQRKRCNSILDKASNTSTACNSTLQCRTRSAGPLCAAAITNYCKCKPSWHAGSLSCLKSCIRDAVRLQKLNLNGCNSIDLKAALAGRSCTFLNPEDCAIYQILRAKRVEDAVVKECSRDAYTMRIRYHKMYYHFKPGKSYWILYILARKGLIAFAGLMFRSNPGFQMAVLLFILFVAFVLQVKHQPYMSSAQRDLVLSDHKEKADAGAELHKAINDKVKRFLSRTDKIKHPVSRTVRALSDVKTQSVRSMVKETKRSYFFDYNTVEQVLLACSIFICLAGVMFESDRFEEDEQGALVTGRFDWQREMITFAASGIILFSLVYYFLVFVSEVFGIAPKWCMQKQRKSMFKEFNDVDEGLELSVNMMKARDENLEELEHLRRGQKQLVAINETLVADKKREKSEKSKLNSKKNPLRSKGRAKKQKIAFAQSLE
eukprot:Stramenopile-MAST_4_protein_1045